jgi:hypothetical protein
MTTPTTDFEKSTQRPVQTLAQLGDTFQRAFAEEGYRCCRALVTKHVPLEKMPPDANPAEEEINFRLIKPDGSHAPPLPRPLSLVSDSGSIWSDYPSTIQLVDTTLPGGPRYGFVYLSDKFLEAQGLTHYVVPGLIKWPQVAALSMGRMRRALEILTETAGGRAELAVMLQGMGLTLGSPGGAP